MMYLCRIKFCIEINQELHMVLFKIRNIFEFKTDYFIIIIIINQDICKSFDFRCKQT